MRRSDNTVNMVYLNVGLTLVNTIMLAAIVMVALS